MMSLSAIESHQTTKWCHHQWSNHTRQRMMSSSANKSQPTPEWCHHQRSNHTRKLNNVITSNCITPRVHKNKSMQHHTLGSGTAEFQVTWPPKLHEGTYLVKNVRARFEYRKTIATHEKQVIMQKKAQPCASLWRKTLRPKRVRFLAIDAPIVD